MRQSVEAILDVYGRLKERSMAERHSFERSWYRNVLFGCGHQWLVYSPSRNQWVPPTDIKPWIPRPVTNKFGAAASAIIQVIAGKSPDTRVIPGTDSANDVAVAAVADRNLDVILYEAKANQARRQLAAWMTYCGGGFMHPCYDPDVRAGSTTIQHAICPTCPGAKPVPPDAVPDDTCPQCGSGMIPAMKPDGKPIGEKLPNGRTKLEVFSPFEVYYDLEARSMDEIEELYVRRRYPIGVMRDKYGSEIEAQSGGESGLGLTLLRAIAYASGDSSAFISGGDRAHEANVTTDYVWKRPCDDYPEGLCAVIINGKLVNEGETDIPYQDREGNKLWPWHYVPFDRVAGRMTGRTPLDDAAPLQVQRNRLESLIQLIIMRTAAPGWLIPRGLGADTITGDPGQIITYDPYEQRKPEQFQGQNVPTSLIARLEKLDSDIEEICGTFNVLRGSAPPGVSAGTALRLLLERAQTRFTPVIEGLEEEWEPAISDLLCIFQQYATEDRIRRIQGPGHSWEVERFSRAELQGQLVVKVTSRSAIPKNTVGTQSLIQDFIAEGVIDPQNPETRYEILNEFGMTKLLGSSDLNIQHAKREAYDFFDDERHLPPVVDPLIDNHMIHLMEHKSTALKSDFQDLPEEVREIWRRHILDHELAMQPPPMPEEGGKPGAKKPGEQAGAPGSGGSPPMPPGPGAPSPSPMPGTDNGQPPMPGGPMIQ
jgi:hypothetical protein